MKRVLIFGNSGAGKSTLAKRLSQQQKLKHLDLDTLAWLPVIPPSRRPIDRSKPEIERFVVAHSDWVIEGCYADLLRLVTPYCTEMIFLNPGIEACVTHCRSRPWEPYKYPSKQAQDANLEMLVAWVRDYLIRKDEFSVFAHREIFDAFKGKKVELTHSFGVTPP